MTQLHDIYHFTIREINRISLHFPINSNPAVDNEFFIVLWSIRIRSPCRSGLKTVQKTYHYSRHVHITSERNRFENVTFAAKI
jgi:hypothetical protein